MTKQFKTGINVTGASVSGSIIATQSWVQSQGYSTGGGGGSSSAFSTNVLINNSSGSSTLLINTNAALVNAIQFQNTTSPRWEINHIGNDELGGNTGSDLDFNYYDDSGVLLGTNMAMHRYGGIDLYTWLQLNNNTLYLKGDGSGSSIAPLTFSTSSVVSGTVGAGSMEYNGTAFFLSGKSGATTGRGIVLAPQIIRLNASRAKAANTTAPEAIYDSANDTISLNANTLYYFRQVLLGNSPASGNNNAITAAFTFSQTPVMIEYKYISYVRGNAATAQSTGYSTVSSSTTVTAQNTAAANYVIELEGWIKSNATTGGTLIPQFGQLTTGTTSGASVVANSFFMIQPMSSNVSATNIAGAWS